jgi:hypothetical protein
MKFRPLVRFIVFYCFANVLPAEPRMLMLHQVRDAQKMKLNCQQSPYRIQATSTTYRKIQQPTHLAAFPTRTNTLQYTCPFEAHCELDKVITLMGSRHGDLYRQLERNATSFPNSVQ